MKGSPTAATLAAVTTLLVSTFPELTTESLVEALKAYNREGAKRPLETLTRRQVADILHVSLPTVNRMLNDGRLHRIKLSGRQNGAVRVSSAEVMSLMK